jgi:monothiol glutaredoxin|tara:strand:+ start:1494 stop:1799 length:306 start_codon:yes stop_codon:yes gene_type:complete
MRDIHEEISQLLRDHHIVLFMKGTPVFPQCGFSSQVVAILKEYDVEYHPINVLQDDEVRQGIKEFGNWPTIPQLYVDGQLIGGCDIITSMHENEELSKVFS